MPLAPHSKIGRYEILALAGAGGMGEVYRARDTRLERNVAVKILSPTLHADAAAIARFEQEARAASALNHPSIVTVFDAGTENGQPFLVTELLEGLTLRARLEAGALPVGEAIAIAIAAARGLGAAHAAGIVHRDVKPENLFVTRRDAVKILDFGVARLASSEKPSNTTSAVTETSAGHVIGTAGYMAPEQARGDTVDSRADIFAFGCVLYEMLTGARAFQKATPVETMASILSDEPATAAAGRAVPPSVQRILDRCLAKDPAERFQSAADLAFALEAAGDDSRAGPAEPARRFDRWLRAAALAAIAVGAALAAWSWSRSPSVAPTASISAVSVVPPSAKPIAPVVSPDAKWVAYISVAESQPSLMVQFLNGGTPINLTRDSDIPVSNRTIVGGIDISPDGSTIGLAGRPRAAGLWTIPGVWLFPAPMGGPPRRVTDRYASIRWSPDGRRFAAILANPIRGDAVVVSDTDAQNERILLPAAGGIHRHQVAWSPDQRYVYYAQTLEPNHSISEIFRVAVADGSPEPVVRTSGIAMHPAPTPDGRAVIYAGDHNGEGLNIWWRPLDGAPERRLTAGAGEYTEPYISRDGQVLVCLARRRKGELLKINLDQAADPSPITIGAAASGDSEPSISRGSDRLFISSARSGRRRIWSIDMAGGQPVPLTSGDSLDQRPVVSPDGTQVAYTTNRDGKRGIWIVPAAGGTPRPLLSGAILDRVSWSPDGRRLVYALAGDAAPALWIGDASGAKPVEIPGGSGRTPAWSPTGDVIALVRADNDKPAVHFLTSSGTKAREPLMIDPVGLPTAMTWSPDGTRLALVNLPGRAAAEVWVLSVDRGALTKVAQFAAPAELDGITWTSDGRSVVIGRTDYETEVLLLRGLQPE